MNLSSDFSLNSYSFDLPKELIATEPQFPRHSSRLLVLHRKSARIEHRTFEEITDYLDPGDLLVANNTKVMRARLLGYRLLPSQNGKAVRGGKIEFLALRKIESQIWEGMFHASAKGKVGLRFEVCGRGAESIRAEIVKGSIESEAGTVWAKFERDPIDLEIGEVPLPPYIEKLRRAEVRDESNYQTTYAKELGSSAAPTAGLHFSGELRQNLEKREVGWAELTLHIGPGTFRPVKVDDIREHLMHEEEYEISRSVVDRISAAKKQKRKVISIGTTSARALESAWSSSDDRVREGVGKTSLFIHPGGTSSFQMIDGLITNFHLPQSTLFMLVCALAGRDLVFRAYSEAIEKKYRFFSYGDAMLIL